MRNSSLLVMEIIWIATGALSFSAAIRCIVKGDNNKILIFALLALVSFIFAWVRHKQRKKD